MKVLKGLILFSSALITILSAQLIDDMSEFTQKGVGYDMSEARASAAFLDWSKVQMHHSVSMSMGASGMGSQSYLTYHNQFSMPLSSKLSFYGNLYWQLQAYASNPALARINSPAGDLYFDANLVYKISENTSISLAVGRYPSLYGYSHLPGSYNYYNSFSPFNSMYNGYYPRMYP
ncbi:MAG: hypothetical protein WCT23_06465 [Candidatus Neomarinimicrobiota bacterium]